MEINKDDFNYCPKPIHIIIGQSNLKLLEAALNNIIASTKTVETPVPPVVVPTGNTLTIGLTNESITFKVKPTFKKVPGYKKPYKYHK